MIADAVIERQPRFRGTGSIDPPARQLLINGCFVSCETKMKFSFFNRSRKPAGTRTSTTEIFCFMSNRFFHLQSDSIFDFAVLEDFCRPCLKLGMVFVLFSLEVMEFLDCLFEPFQKDFAVCVSAGVTLDNQSSFLPSVFGFARPYVVIPLIIRSYFASEFLKLE